MTDLFQQSYATFSQDGKHRLVLFRQWDKSKPVAMVIGLNPSTADDKDDDPTIGFVKRVLNHNGYGGLYMVNLFTFITPHPDECEYDEDVNKAIQIWRATAPFVQTVIFAWGRFKTFGRDLCAKREFPDPYCFGKNKDGTPRHPMYLKENTPIIKF